MKVTLDREGKNVVSLLLELESEKAVKAYEVACRSLSHQMNIPGFRRGKAPRNIIEKHVGVDYIKREALERIVPELLRQAIETESLDIITEPEIASCDFELGSPLKFRARFEVRPEVSLGQYTELTVKVPQAKLPDDAMERALLSIAESKASLRPATPRAVEKGDTVLLDFECYVEGSLVEGGKAEGLVLEVKEGTFIEGFCDQLVGKQPESTFDVNVKFPDEYRNKELAGKDANFKVDLKEIRERFIPAVDDELAKSIGQESLDKLKEALQERLGEEVRQENEMRAQRHVVDCVVAGSQVDIPETMVERERDLLLQQIRKYLEQQGQKWEVFEQTPEYEKMRQAKFGEARQRVLTSLVLGAVVRAEKMSVGDDEMAPYLAELVSRYNLPVEQVARNEELRRQVMEEVLTNKVVQFLVGKALIEAVPEEEHIHGEACDHQEHESKSKSEPESAPESAAKPEAEKDQQDRGKGSEAGQGEPPKGKKKAASRTSESSD